MLKIIGSIVTLFLALSCTTKKQDPVESINISEFQLKNGLTVILVPNEKAPLTEVIHWVKAGSLHEKPGVTGIAHLFEHMMFRPLTEGTKGFFEKTNRLGASVNASTRFGSTVYTTTVPNDGLEDLLKLEAERFKGLKVNQKLLNIERKAVRSEYSTKMDANPVIDLWEKIYRAGFENHPYGWMIIGERGDLDKIDAKACNEFFDRFYRPNNTGIIISGDFEAAIVREWIEKYYSDWKPKKIDFNLPKVNMSPGLIKAQGNLEAKSRFVLVGHRIPRPTADNYQTQELANYILYGSDFSLAERSLKIDKKFVSTVSDFNFQYDLGMMKSFYQLLPKAKLADLISEVNNLKVAFKKMSEKEFATYKSHYILGLAESAQKNTSLANKIALGWGKYGNKNALYPLKNLGVSKKALSNFLDTYLRKENMTVVTNKNFKEAL